MYIVRCRLPNQPESMKFVASKKGLPFLVATEAAARNISLDVALSGCSYEEINTKESRNGEILLSKPLSELVCVKCALIQDTPDETEE